MLFNNTILSNLLSANTVSAKEVENFMSFSFIGLLFLVLFLSCIILVLKCRKDIFDIDTEFEWKKYVYLYKISTISTDINFINYKTFVKLMKNIDYNLFLTKDYFHTKGSEELVLLNIKHQTIIGINNKRILFMYINGNLYRFNYWKDYIKAKNYIYKADIYSEDKAVKWFNTKSNKYCRSLLFNNSTKDKETFEEKYFNELIRQLKNLFTNGNLIYFKNYHIDEVDNEILRDEESLDTKWDLNDILGYNIKVSTKDLNSCCIFFTYLSVIGRIILLENNKLDLRKIDTNISYILGLKWFINCSENDVILENLINIGYYNDIMPFINVDGKKVYYHDPKLHYSCYRLYNNYFFEKGNDDYILVFEKGTNMSNKTYLSYTNKEDDIDFNKLFIEVGLDESTNV